MNLDERAATKLKDWKWNPNQDGIAGTGICPGSNGVVHRLAVNLKTHKTLCFGSPKCDEQLIVQFFANGQTAPVLPPPPPIPATDLTSWKLKLYDLAQQIFEQSENHALLAGSERSELIETLVGDFRNAIAAKMAVILPLPEQSETDREEDLYNVAGAAVDAFQKEYKVDRDLPTANGEQPDPILATIDKALVEVVSADALSFSTATSFLEGFRTERSQTVPLCDGLLRTRNVALLVGRAWAGKTTLAANLTRALVLGERFLGRQCKADTRVAYLALERNGGEVAELFEKWGIADRVLFLDRVPIGEPREMARALAHEIHRKGVEITIVDHLVGMIHLQDGNDYVGVSRALAPFNAIAKYTSSNVFLLHHQPKTAGAGSEINVMGSEAFRAATDCLLEASKIGQNYFFRAQSRGVPDVERMRIFRKEDGSLEAEPGVDGLKAEILSVLGSAEAPVTSKGILELSPELKSVPIKHVMMALKRLAEENMVCREGKGKPRSPFYYSVGAKTEGNLFAHVEDRPQPVVGGRGNKTQEKLDL